jgi:hypothetical protein
MNRSSGIGLMVPQSTERAMRRCAQRPVAENDSRERQEDS